MERRGAVAAISTPHDLVTKFIGTGAERRRVPAKQRVLRCPPNVHVALFLLQFLPLQAGIHSLGLGIAMEFFVGLSLQPVKPKKHRCGTENWSIGLTWSRTSGLVLLLACAVLCYQGVEPHDKWLLIAIRGASSLPAMNYRTLRVHNRRPALEIGCTLCSFNAVTRSKHYAAAHQGRGRTKA